MSSSTNNILLSDWMGQSSRFIQEKPLVELCIPGSHDAFSWALDRRGPIAHDQPHWLHIVAKLFPPVKTVVYNWSVCQTLSLLEQLENGIRYLDIRLSCQNDSICTIHGLCGQDLDSLLSQVDLFLKQHPSEIILLDFNHFYCMQWCDHLRALGRLLSLFGPQCCPSPPFVDQTSINLSTCWQYGWRVIIFYQLRFGMMENLLSSIPTGEYSSTIHCPLPYLFWTSQFIKSPWPNTPRIDRMLDYNECCLINKKNFLPYGGFFISQGVLTPRVRDVFWGLFSTLRDKMGIPGTKAFLDWLIQLGPATMSNLNVVMADFIEIEDFCRRVIALNSRHASAST